MHRRSFDFFFFNDTATTEIYTLSLHDALPICSLPRCGSRSSFGLIATSAHVPATRWCKRSRSEEYTSELQSPDHLVCRLLLEKKKLYNDRLSRNAASSSRTFYARRRVRLPLRL